MSQANILYPNLYALLESNSSARRLFDHAPAQVRRQLLVRQDRIRSVAALDAAICAMRSLLTQQSAYTARNRKKDDP